jgi:probable F420-dependent oxidoreductase
MSQARGPLTGMRFGIYICILGDNADPRVAVEYAVRAEESGWDAVFVWDHLAFAWGVPSAEAWVTMAAIAQATERVRIGPAVAVPPRRRPATLASAVATLDLLSGGRFILGAGLGGEDAEFASFGDDPDLRVRAAQLDESLDVMNRLWYGETVHHHGAHYSVDGVTLAPRPVQRPRVPVWIGGASKPALRRAARWDGWIGGADDQAGTMVITPDQVAAHRAYMLHHRESTDPFDIALSAVSAPRSQTLFEAYAEAGVTWWLEHLHGYRSTRADLMARITAGP